MARRNASRRTARRSRRNRSNSSHSFVGRSLSGRSIYTRRLRLEPLEDRRLLAVVTVTTLSDTVDFTDGLTSLREAIFAANIVPGADTIDFAPALTAGGPAKILLSQGELAITDPLTIDGPGADTLTIDAQQQSRIFNITVATGDYTIVGLTLTGGRTISGDDSGGGAIHSLSIGTLTIDQSDISGNRTADFNSTQGGGVFANGNVALTQSIVGQNTSSSGGGVFARGNVTLDHSTVSDNSALKFDGGGILSLARVTLTESIVSGNNAARSGGGISAGFRDNFRFVGEVDVTNSTISGNIAAGGNGAGGGVFCNGMVTVNGSIVSGNKSNNNFSIGESGGGGIYSRGFLTLNASTVSGNSASGDPVGGGGINARGGATLNQCIVIGNSTSGGGGGIRTAGALMLTDSIVSGNSASNGGGISMDGDVILNRSSVSGNTSPNRFAEAAGIDAIGSVTLLQSTVSDNRASGTTFGAGGIFARNVVLNQSTVSGNSSGFGGGVVAFGNIELTLSTIANNSAASSIGGVQVVGVGAHNIRIVGSILAANAGGDIGTDSYAVNTSFDIRYSLIGKNAGTTLAERSVGLPDANGNLIGGPVHGVIDPLLGPLADNGGFALPDGSHILTQALLPGSPAINAGDLAAVAGQNGVPEFDGRGTPFGRVVGGRIDIGAVEYEPAGFLAGDFNGNGIVDGADYTVWRDTLGATNDLRADGNGDGVVNQLDYDVWKANFGATLPTGAGSGSGAVVVNDVVQGLLSNRTAGQASSGTRVGNGASDASTTFNQPPADPEAGYPAGVGAAAVVALPFETTPIKPPAEPGAAGTLALRTHFETAARQDRLLALWAAARDNSNLYRRAERSIAMADGSKSLADFGELSPGEPVATLADDGSVDADALDCALAGVGDLRLTVVRSTIVDSTRFAARRG